MPTPRMGSIARRDFLGGTIAGLWATAGGWADDAPAPPLPRATSGDAVAEPNWAERLTVSVGPRQADIVGDSDRAIQAAVDYVARLGGGAVRILPGLYRLRNAIYLRSGVRIVGSGDDSVLRKEPAVETKLSADSDWYDQEITLVDGRGFNVGDGVCLRARNPHHGGANVVKRTLVARDGNRFKLDRPLRENFWKLGEATVATLFPILSGEKIADVTIEKICLDGNKEHNPLLDGNYAGCIFMQDCNRVAIREVEAKNYNGDGISWQICHDVVVEDCHSHDHTGLGLHPGSGSQRPIMRGNTLEGNDIGVFFCWGVKFGVAERNGISKCRVGVSIGHRDTDNVIRDNDIVSSKENAVLFRPERGPTFAPHRNRLEKNRMKDNGPTDGVAVDVQGGVESIEIAGNELRETRGAGQRIGVRVGADAGANVRVGDNQIEGFATAIVDLRQKSPAPK